MLFIMDINNENQSGLTTTTKPLSPKSKQSAFRLSLPKFTKLQT